MARVSEAEVQAIMPDYPDDLTTAISMANLVVTEDLETLGTLSDDRLKEVERWLAAHFAATISPLTTQESVGSVSQGLQRGTTSLGFGTTQYGQNAMTLDTTGTLRRMAERKVVPLMFGSVSETWQDEDSDS